MLNKKLFYPSCGPMPYESIYSIYLKISHANYIAFPKLGRALGLVSDRQWALHKLTRWLEHNVEDIYTHLPWTYAPSSCIKLLSHGKFRFCKECARFGYHAVFNSIASHQICVLHKCVLTEACRSCAKQFLAGFHNCSNILQPAVQCPVCGFQNINIYSELKARRSRGLLEALENFGSNQAKWYSAVRSVDQELQGYRNLYLADEIHRDYFTGAFERLTGLDSPETLAGSTRDTQSFVLLKKYINLRPHLGSRVEPQSVACEKLERRYLTGHLSCLNLLSQMVGYPDGQEMEISLCPMSLAYALLCIKNIYGVWPTPGAASIYIKGLRKLEMPSKPSDPVSCYRSALLVFLSILGRLEYYISKRESFYIICRPGHKYLIQDEISGVIFRRSSYSFRSACRSVQPNIRAFRDGVGGPILIIVDPQERPGRDYRFIKRVIF